VAPGRADAGLPGESWRGERCGAAAEGGAAAARASRRAGSGSTLSLSARRGWCAGGPTGSQRHNIADSTHAAQDNNGASSHTPCISRHAPGLQRGGAAATSTLAGTVCGHFSPSCYGQIVHSWHPLVYTSCAPRLCTPPDIRETPVHASHSRAVQGEVPVVPVREMSESLTWVKLGVGRQCAQPCWIRTLYSRGAEGVGRQCGQHVQGD
jgi:hypothetical protein